MTGGTRREPIDDDAIDRMLQDALAVEPSRDLSARVRARVAAEPVHLSRRGLWLWAGAAAAIVVLALTLTTGSLSEREPAPSTSVALEGGPGPAVTTRAAAPLAAPDTGGAAARASADRVVHPPARSAVTTRAAVDDPRPPPVHLEARPPRFDLREREAFLQLLAISRAGGLPPFDATAPGGNEDDVVVPGIEITAIDIQPAVMTAGIEGEPQ